MTWRQAHLYYDALLAVVADVERTADGTLPWRPEFTEVFGDPAGLVLALRRRWQLMVQAQVEVPYNPSGQPSAALRTLAEHNRGMLAVLRRHGQEPYLTGPHAVGGHDTTPAGLQLCTEPRARGHSSQSAS